MTHVDCEIILILTWSESYLYLSSTPSNQVTTFTITDTKLYVPFVTLSTNDSVKLLKQIKPGFKRTINWKNIAQM